MRNERRFAVIIEAGEGSFSAYSPDLPGCVSTGQTVVETVKNMTEAIRLHLEGLEEDARPIANTSTVATEIVPISR